jgi:hypothetical protein
MPYDLERIARVFTRDARRIEQQLLQCGPKMKPGEVAQAQREAAALRKCCEALPGCTADEALAAIDEVCMVCEGSQ